MEKQELFQTTNQLANGFVKLSSVGSCLVSVDTRAMLQTWEYPLVNIPNSMANHNVSSENSLFLSPCSIAMLNYERVMRCGPSGNLAVGHDMSRRNDESSASSTQTPLGNRGLLADVFTLVDHIAG